jgi:hypothetical protein
VALAKLHSRPLACAMLEQQPLRSPLASRQLIGNLNCQASIPVNVIKDMIDLSEEEKVTIDCCSGDDPV